MSWRASSPRSASERRGRQSRLDSRLATAERRLDGAIAHAAVIRYDALDEMSGRQSSSVALLDAQRNGVVLSSIPSATPARLYAKPVSTGAPS